MTGLSRDHFVAKASVITVAKDLRRKKAENVGEKAKTFKRKIC